jgi:choline dehydrogenase-like flavoprotein
METIKSKSRRPFDVIVVGSGAGGSAAAYRLAKAGLEILLVEKGDRLAKDARTLSVEQVVKQGVYRSQEDWLQANGRMFRPEEYFNLGGKTKWYGAALARFSPDEFEPDAELQCPGWPLTYAELEPHYHQVEQLLGVRTFPMEAGLQDLLASLRRAEQAWLPAPLPLGLDPAIVDDPVEASHFDGFASPTGRKADAERAFLSVIDKERNVTVITGNAAVDLIGDHEDAVRVSGVRMADGCAAHADAVILAAGALHSPRLLQRYLQRHALNHLPMADNVGRFLKLHLLTAVLALSHRPQHDLLRKTVLITHRELPHSSIQPLGFDGELLAGLIPAAVPRIVASAMGHRAYGFFLQTEDGSHPHNRVLDAGMPGNDGASLPRLDYSATRLRRSEAEHRRLTSSFRHGLLRAGYPNFAKRIGLAGTAHACGSLMAGTDPHRSVVNGVGQVHGMQGLYVADGSILPRISRVNPSLTIYAWALRVADAILASGTGRTAQPAEVRPDEVPA